MVRKITITVSKTVQAKQYEPVTVTVSETISCADEDAVEARKDLYRDVTKATHSYIANEVRKYQIATARVADDE